MQGFWPFDWSETSLISMKTVGAYEAKTHLARLLDEVARGETITITRHGQSVARLVPPADEPVPVTEVVTALLEARKGARLEGDSVRDMIDEGRRS